MQVQGHQDRLEIVSSEDVPEIPEQEIEAALKQTRNGKGPEEDEISRSRYPENSFAQTSAIRRSSERVVKRKNNCLFNNTDTCYRLRKLNELEPATPPASCGVGGDKNDTVGLAGRADSPQDHFLPGRQSIGFLSCARMRENAHLRWLRKGERKGTRKEQPYVTKEDRFFTRPVKSVTSSYKGCQGAYIKHALRSMT